MMLGGWPSVGLGRCGARAGFRVWDVASGLLLGSVESGLREVALDRFSLGEGERVLAVEAVDAYGTVSERREVLVEVVGGAAADGLLLPELRGVWLEAGGVVGLRWLVWPGRAGVLPVAFEVGRLEGASVALLGAVDGGRWGAFEYETTGFGHGAEVVLAVRSSDGEVSGQRSGWVVAEAVRADGEAEEAPVVVPPVVRCPLGSG